MLASRIGHKLELERHVLHNYGESRSAQRTMAEAFSFIIKQQHGSSSACARSSAVQARDSSHLGVIHKILLVLDLSRGRGWGASTHNSPPSPPPLGGSSFFDTRAGLVQHLGERPHHFPSDRLQWMQPAAGAANGLSGAAATAAVNGGGSIPAVANESASFLSRIQPRITADARIHLLLRLLPPLAGRFSYVRV